MGSRGQVPRDSGSPEKFMKESVFEMSLEAYVEEVGMEMEEQLGRTLHLFVSPVQASPSQHMGLCMDQTTMEEVVRTKSSENQVREITGELWVQESKPIGSLVNSHCCSLSIENI